MSKNNNNTNRNNNINKAVISNSNSGQNSNNNFKGGFYMNNTPIQTTTTQLPANISKTMSVIPDMRIPTDTITVYTDPTMGLDVLCRTENGVELLTFVKDNDFLVVSVCDPGAPTPISAIFGSSEDSKTHLHFDLETTMRILERGDATVLFYLTELTTFSKFSANEILRLFDVLTEININQESLFRALERSSDKEIEAIFEAIENGDAIILKNIINNLNDVHTYDRNFLEDDSYYDKDNNDDMDDYSDEYDGYFDGDSYEDDGDDD